MSDRKAELLIEWERIDAEWKALTEARTKWLDDHMADFAKYPIGTPLYRRDGKQFMGSAFIGNVARYYRFHRDRDPRYDRPSLDYETDDGANSSSLSGMVESAKERAARLETEVRYLRDGATT